MGEFNAGLRNITTYGSYTIVASANVYDTSGDPPPALSRAVIHFPRGATLRRRFLVQHFFCDPAKLMQTPLPAVCANAHLASGTMVLDARPQIEDAFPVNIDLFLSKGTGGSTANVTMLVKSNLETPVYDYQVLEGSLVRDTRFDRRFGYRLELPTALTPLLPQVTLRLAELHLRIRGLVLRRHLRKCVKRSSRSHRCVRRKRVTRSLFWIKAPRCPRSKEVTFGADYEFEGAAPVTKRRRISCAQFLRHRAVHRRGGIPGAP